MRVYLLGIPGPYAGANTEMWHAIRVWRRCGIDVVVVPTWDISPEWRAKVLSTGCEVKDATADTILDVDGIRGAIVVAFCNKQFLSIAYKLRSARCKLVWVNCMTFALQNEIPVFKTLGPPEALVLHTDFQRNRLFQHYLSLGLTIPEDRIFKIRGAFVFEDFKFLPRPHKPRDVFCVCKVARMDLDKWPPNLWHIQRDAQRRTPSMVCMLLMGADDRVRAKLGPQPVWSVLLNANAVEPRALYRASHCMLAVNGTAKENWPRVGLEAMASGVPIIATNDFGWTEMLIDGESGILRDSAEGYAEAIARLANDEEFRMFIANNAYTRLKQIADPDTIGHQWKELFEQVDAREY